MPTIDGYELSDLQAKKLQRNTNGKLGMIFDTDEGRIWVDIDVLRGWEFLGQGIDPYQADFDKVQHFIRLLDQGEEEEASAYLSDLLRTSVTASRIANRITVEYEDGQVVEVPEQELMSYQMSVPKIFKKLLQNPKLPPVRTPTSVGP